MPVAPTTEPCDVVSTVTVEMRNANEGREIKSLYVHDVGWYATAMHARRKQTQLARKYKNAIGMCIMWYRV